MLETPGLTSIHDPVDARRVHLDESLAAIPLVERFPGAIIDVGSGGGAPGIPIAAAFAERQVVLLEANARKCQFLESVIHDFPNVLVVRGRAEEIRVWGRERRGQSFLSTLFPTGLPELGRAIERC